MTAKEYRLIDHTADFGVEIYAPDPTSLFERAAKVLFEVIIDGPPPQGRNRISLAIQGEDWPDLMINWLRELLYLWNGSEQLLVDLEITELSETRLCAELVTGAFVQGQHQIKTDIKAVTYHQIQVAPYKDGWRARVIFDI